MIMPNPTLGELFTQVINTRAKLDSNGKVDNSQLTPVDTSSLATKNNPEFTGTISFGRKENTTVGTYSVALGYNVTASGDISFAEGITTTASNAGAHAEGSNTTASETGSHAEGMGTTASNTGAHAEGYGSQATGLFAHAEGQTTAASGQQAHAEGSSTTASGSQSHAEGANSTASGSYSHTEGYYTGSYGNQSHAEGNYTIANGNNSHAEGSYTKAYGVCSHAEGSRTQSTETITINTSTYKVGSHGYSSHAEGQDTTAGGSGAHAEGYQTNAIGYYSHAEGYGSQSKVTIDNQAQIIAALGDADHTEGYCTRTGSSGTGKHAEGYQTAATSGNGSHAEGYMTKASNMGTHAEGYGTSASGTGAHAEGQTSIASGFYSHAEGSFTRAMSDYAHTEGHYTRVTGAKSNAIGTYTLSNYTAQHSFGSGNYSIDFDSYKKSQEVVTVTNEAPEWIANTKYAYASIVQHTENGITTYYVAHLDVPDVYHPDAPAVVNYNYTTDKWHLYSPSANEDTSQVTEWDNSGYTYGTVVKITEADGTVRYYQCHSDVPTYVPLTDSTFWHTAELNSTFTKYNMSYYYKWLETVGNAKNEHHARSNARALDWDGNEYLNGDLYVGCNADSTGGTKVATVSQIPDTSTLAPKASPVFTGSISLGRASSNTGDRSIAIGDTVIASGVTSQAFGEGAIAQAYCAFAEGFYTNAAGQYSHAEGNSTAASGNAAHSMGANTNAAGSNSLVYGKYNVIDSYSSWPLWQANTEYQVGDKVKLSGKGYVCRLANNRATFSGNDWTNLNNQMNYIEIVGNGTSENARANARTLDWDGNERLNGDLYVRCNADSTGGTKVIPLPAVTSSDNGKALEVVEGEWTVGNEKINRNYKPTYKWSPKTWNGLTNFTGSNVWTDGNNIYYSSGSNQYILDKSTFTWSAKTWDITDLSGSDVWTDGDNLYYSSVNKHYIFDKSTSTWSTKTWTGLTSFFGQYIWTDGDNIYYSDENNQYVLDKSTSTWSTKTWNGLTNFQGEKIWTDGDNIYYSDNYNPTQLVLDKSTSTWSTKTWYGLTDFNGYEVWTDGNDIYYSSGYAQYVLDKSTSTWSTKVWNGLTKFDGNHVWKDGETIYYSKGSTAQYVMNDINTVLFGTNGEFNSITIDEFPGLLPAPPTTDGTYTLQVTISSGIPTYTWVSGA